MKKAFIILLVIIILGAGAYFLFLQPGAGAVLGENAVPTQSAALNSNLIAPETEVEALGRLVPARYSELHFHTSGIIQEIMVREGQEVKAGDVIARLRDEKQMKLAVSQARLEVMNAEKALSNLEINAPLQAAQALYDITQLEKEMEKIQKRRTAMDYPRATQEEINDAYEAYEDAEDKFNQVTDYFKTTDDVYKAAKLQRNNALSTYNWLIGKYTDLEKRETESNYLLHERRIAELERQYKIYSNGPDPEEVAIAEARIAVAKDQLAAAEAGFDDLTLVAPFSGVIARLDFEPGQGIAASQPLLLLADLSRWNIETEDLTELSVIRINEGAAAQIWIDALPNTTFTARSSR
jgi:multidrug efflux pump subunit AcrA (membrane-fusion protein)